jgi:hypothetical protein
MDPPLSVEAPIRSRNKVDDSVPETELDGTQDLRPPIGRID